MVAALPLRHTPDDPNTDQRGALAERVILVTGASTGLGLALVDRLLAQDQCATLYAGCRDISKAIALKELAAQDERLQLVQLDVTDEASARAAAAQMQASGRLDLVINTVGILHQPDGMQPEKRLTDIRFDDLLLAYDVNALGALRLALALESLLAGSRTPRFVSLSARVGSISDNRAGGWYAYRASKAALNMLLRTLAIEWARKMPAISCVALHPGTVATELSRPFTPRTRLTVFNPDEAAQNLLSVIEQLEPDQNGGFYAWDGQEVPW